MIWDAGPEADIPIEGDDDDELLGPEDAKLYRELQRGSTTSPQIGQTSRTP